MAFRSVFTGKTNDYDDDDDDCTALHSDVYYIHIITSRDYELLLSRIRIEI